MSLGVRKIRDKVTILKKVVTMAVTFHLLSVQSIQHARIISKDNNNIKLSALYYSSMSSSQLSNPQAVWFLGAPVSKAIAITAVVTYIVAEMNKLHQALIFGASTTSLYVMLRRYSYHFSH